MDKQQLSKQMTAEQFAAFDTQLYLDTHPDDMTALKMFNDYQKNHAEYKKQYEQMFGPVSSDNVATGGKWSWIDNPWPWEREAN